MTTRRAERRINMIVFRPLVFALFLLQLSALAACASTPPRVINHREVSLAADRSVFAPRRTGCAVGPAQPGRFDCAEGTLAELGCDRIFVEDQLAGLGAPAAVCWKFSYEKLPSNEFFRGPQGFIPLHERFVVFRNGKFELVRNMSELKERFAPVTSPSQAISYAVAATGLQVGFGNTFDPKLRYFVETVEDTFVISEADGFTVNNLLDYKGFGCGPHPTYFVNVKVMTDGSVTELNRVRAFEDPKDDRLCVD